MGSKLYVSNLSYEMTAGELKRLFVPFGTVQEVQVIEDRETRQSRGFAFVDMATEPEAQAAIAGLNGKEIGGRHLTVKVASAREGQRKRLRSLTRKVGEPRKHAPALGRRLRRPPSEPGKEV